MDTAYCAWYSKGTGIDGYRAPMGHLGHIPGLREFLEDDSLVCFYLLGYVY